MALSQVNRSHLQIYVSYEKVWIVSLSKSFGKEWFLARTHFSKHRMVGEVWETKVWGYFLTIAVFWEHRAHLLFYIFRLHPGPTESETPGL